jgi:hypothetical protein
MKNLITILSLIVSHVKSIVMACHGLNEISLFILQ